ncbi:MAG: glycosyltransferase family 2 protein [Kineosporiaceae bacterium]
MTAIRPAAMTSPATAPEPSLVTAFSTTVVICTYTLERWDELCAAVESASTQSIVPDEIVVVADHNEELLGRIETDFGHRVTALPNTRTRGLSGARNSAVEHVHTDLVAFLDDDAVADPQWLARLVRPFTDATVNVTGSWADPRWPDSGTAPDFLPRELWWIVGCSYTGQPRTAADVRNVLGCGMVFRREVFDLVGGFNEHLGRVGKIPLGGEETELCIRLRRQRPESRVVFEPSAVLHHQVSRERVRWSYLIRRSYAEGLSKALLARLAGTADATRAERSYLSRTVPAALRREARNGGRGVIACAAIITSAGAAAAGFALGRIRLVLGRGGRRRGTR